MFTRLAFISLLMFCLWGCSSINKELGPNRVEEYSKERPNPRDLEESESNLQP